jgi:hypothetical protein
MKSLFVIPWAVAGLLFTAGAAHGQGMQPAGRAAQEQNANESVQDITDMSYSEMGQSAKTPSHSLTNVSYGGTPDVQGQAGAPAASPCVSGPQCNLFRGR